MPSVRLRPGKAEYVRTEEGNICLCEYNADFSNQGCISQVHGSVLQEVMDNNGQYAKGKIHEHRKEVGVDHRCMYCYAARHNWGKVTPKQVTEMTRKDFETFKPRVIRIGKNTESLHPFYLDVFRDFLGLCEEYDTRIIAPTKAFPFTEDLVDRLRGRGVINYSIGNDRLESGAVSQGFTNAWRMIQARSYWQRGVYSTLTVTCDVTSSFVDNVERGFDLLALKISEVFGIPLRILPLRINSRKLAKLATGKNWHEAVFSSDTLEDMFPGFQDIVRGERRYIRRRNNEAIPGFFHPDFQKLVDSGVGVCGQVGEYEYCDKCQVFETDTRLKIPVSELVKVNYSAEFYRDRENLRRKRKKARIEAKKSKGQKEIAWQKG